MNRLPRSSLFSVLFILGISGSSTAMAKQMNQLDLQEKFKPYQCEGNGIISHKSGISTLNTLNYFGTSITIDVYDSKPENASTALCHALNVVQEYHYLASNYSTYPHVENIKSINNNPSINHNIDPKLTELISAGLEWYNKSDGYFNIALTPVIDVWRKHRNACNSEIKSQNRCTIPSSIELNEAAKHINIHDVKLNTTANTISMKQGMSIDLGGIAKGWMAEKVYEQLKSDGLTSFMINAGGNIRHYGLHPEGREFVTAIEDPLCKKFDYQLRQCRSIDGQYHEIIHGQDLTVVSSGNYLNYYRVGGKEYHHIIDSKTLQPKPEGISTSVVLDEQQIFADVISTTLFLMPLGQALEFANRYGYLEAVWYLDDEGNKVSSANFEKYRFRQDGHDEK